MRVFPAFLFTVAIFAADPVQIWSPADLKASPAAISGKTLGSYGSHSVSLWRRTKSGEAELHKTKTDLIVIQEGSATLLSGGSIPDAHTTEPNEVRGSTIRGGVSKKVSPGDIIRIPAGTPHQFVLDAGQSVAYLAVKLPR